MAVEARGSRGYGQWRLGAVEARGWRLGGGGGLEDEEGREGLLLEELHLTKGDAHACESPACLGPCEARGARPGLESAGWRTKARSGMWHALGPKVCSAAATLAASR